MWTVQSKSLCARPFNGLAVVVLRSASFRERACFTYCGQGRCGGQGDLPVFASSDGMATVRKSQGLAIVRGGRGGGKKIPDNQFPPKKYIPTHKSIQLSCPLYTKWLCFSSPVHRAYIVFSFTDDLQFVSICHTQNTEKAKTEEEKPASSIT